MSSQVRMGPGDPIFHKADRFGYQTLKFGQKRTVAVGAVVDSIAIATPLENSGGGEAGELALEAGRRDAEVTGQVRQIPLAIQALQDSGEDRLSGSRKESVQWPELTHNA